MTAAEARKIASRTAVGGDDTRGRYSCGLLLPKAVSAGHVLRALLRWLAQALVVLMLSHGSASMGSVGVPDR